MPGVPVEVVATGQVAYTDVRSPIFAPCQARHRPSAQPLTIGAFPDIVGTVASRTGDTLSRPMGFYSDRILPRIIDLAMRASAIKDERRRCLEPLAGSVLEIGFGSGLNLPFYPATVTKVVGVDPSMSAARLARKLIAAAPFPVEFIGLSAERLPLADGSVETIVSTFTLCTIPDVAVALREMRRVIRPGGRLHFVEHGRADNPAVERWQVRLNGIQRTVFGGCNLDRPISKLIAQAGFEIERLDNDYIKGAPKFAGYLYRGVARPV